MWFFPLLPDCPMCPPKMLVMMCEIKMCPSLFCIPLDQEALKYIVFLDDVDVD